MGYQPRTKPRDHQVEALRRVKARPRSPSNEDIFAYLMEYGAGKSKVICDEFGEREDAGDLQDLLVLAGAGSYRNWDRDKSANQPSEFHRHLSDDIQSRMLTQAWVSGMGVGAKRNMAHFLSQKDPRRPRAMVMNVEALSSVQAARDAAREFLSAPGRRAMLAVDESTVIMNGGAERTKQVMKLRDLAPVRRVLTGLVTPNSPMNLFSQFEFLDWRVLKQRSIFSFRNRYAVVKKTTFLKSDELYRRLETIPGLTEWPANREELINVLEKHRKLTFKEIVKIDVAFRNVEELHDLIEPYSYRVLKKDCLDLPPKIYSPVREVALTDEQRRLYKELVQYASAKLAGGTYVNATMAITQMLRLQQLICGHMVDEDGNEHDVPERRSADMLDVLGEHAGKAIIWVPFIRTLGKLRALLEKEFGEGVTAEFSGRNKSTRLEDESRWLSDPSCRFLLSTQSAGARGNTWLPGTLELFYANNYDLELRLNAEDRPHRDGQTNPVTIVDWVAPGTNEEKVIPALRAKLDIASLIMADGYKDWVV